MIGDDAVEPAAADKCLNIRRFDMSGQVSMRITVLPDRRSLGA